jgi:hypothetical protein
MDTQNNILYDIFVKRNGISNDSFMITKKIKDIYKPFQLVQQESNQLIKIDDDKLITNNKLTSIKKPKQVILNGKIILDETNEKIVTDNNILGSNSIFQIDAKNITIPIEEIKPEYLNYYGVKLIEHNEIFNLNNRLEIALYEMEIGKNYLDDFLVKQNYGNGIYIESHDLPHYYFTNDTESSGYLIIGEQTVSGFALTGFALGVNKTIYIPPYVYHCDGCLVGKYDVIYGKTENYRTYLIHDREDKVVEVFFDLYNLDNDMIFNRLT